MLVCFSINEFTKSYLGLGDLLKSNLYNSKRIFLQLDGELYLAPGFPIPPNTDYKGYHNYIDECLPPESPYLYGLHPNAEIEFLTSTSDNMFRVVFEMQPRDSGAGAGGGTSREEKVRKTYQNFGCFTNLIQ